MGALLISLLTLVLILISVFVVLLVLMQRTSQSGGMGAALGGGAAESAFGSDTNNVLTKATIYCTIAFFVVSLGLFLIYQAKAAERTQTLNPEELIRSTEPSSDQKLPTALENDLTSAVETATDKLAEINNEVEAALEESDISAATDANVDVPVEAAAPTSE